MSMEWPRTNREDAQAPEAKRSIAERLSTCQAANLALWARGMEFQAWTSRVQLSETLLQSAGQPARSNPWR